MPPAANIVCADCQQSFPPAQLDLSANGWRCQKCKLRHDIDVHHGADDQIGELSLSAMGNKASNQLRRVFGAVALSIVAALLLSAGVFSNPRTRSEARMRMMAIASVPCAFVWACYELIAWRRSKKAIEIMNSRNHGEPPTL